jgi:hypothetical protein
MTGDGSKAGGGARPLGGGRRRVPGLRGDFLAKGPLSTYGSEQGTPVVNTPTQANSLRAVNTELRYYAHDTKAGYDRF